MNEKTNSDLVLMMYDAFSRGDVATILANLAEDVVWETPGPSTVPFCGTFHGREGAMKFFQALGNTQKNQRLTTDEVIAQGNKVVTVGRYECDIVATGKHSDGFACHVFTFENGKVTRFLDLADTAKLQAAYTGEAVAAV